jgi:hypothetical protein
MGFDTVPDSIAGQPRTTRCNAMDCRALVVRGTERKARSIFGRFGMTRRRFEASPFARSRQFDYLIETRQLDDDIFWTNAKGRVDAN